MNDLIAAIRKSVQNENWYAALMVALTVPDICGGIDSSDGNSPGGTYSQWFDKYMTGCCEPDLPLMSGADCYALRCAVLHEGSGNTSGQQAKAVIDKYYFNAVGPHLIRIDNILNLSVGNFCEDICAGADQWLSDVAENEDIQTRLSEVIHVHTQPYQPVPGLTLGSADID